MKRRNLWITLIVVAVIAIGGGFFLWQRLGKRGGSEETQTAVVERGTLRVTVTASGRIEPAAQVDLSFDLPGRVAEVAVDLGDQVAAGQVLARLDDTEAALAVRQAEAALAASQAQLALLQAGTRPEQIASAAAQLQAAQAAVAQAVAQRDQLSGGNAEAQIAAAQAQLLAAQADEWAAREAHDQTLQCYTVPSPGGDEEVCPGLGKPEEQARYALNAAEGSLQAAQANLDALQQSTDAQLRAAEAAVWAAAAQRDSAQAQLDLLQAGSTAEDIAAAEAAVAQAEAALEIARNNQRKTVLVAPFDGIVAAVNITAGEMAPAGLPAVSLVDLSSFRITISVDEIDISKLEIGLPAEVTVDALPDTTLSGVVERIGPAATMDQGVTSYPVIVTLDPTDAPLRAGMSATAVVMVDELTDQLLIPNWTVHIDQTTGQPFVYRQSGDSNERVDVHLGVRYQGYSQVLDGLEEGDTLVLAREGGNGFPFGP